MQEELKADQKLTKRIGNVMTIAAWLVLLGLGTVFFERFLAQQHNPNSSVEFVENNATREVILQRNRQGHYVSSGRINGEKVTFLLDTGATDVSIPARIARKLQLQAGPRIPVMTANGAIQVHTTLLEQVQIGNIVLNEVRASINPYMDNDAILLGMSFLKHLDFSQRGDQLVLRQFKQSGS